MAAGEAQKFAQQRGLALTVIYFINLPPMIRYLSA